MASDIITEENELLNGSNRAAFKTYLQMQEAPFEGSRTGSEEDILEYEEPVLNCDACTRKRKCTLGEKVLLVVAAICVIIIIALAVAVGNSNKDQNLPQPCDDSDCLHAASSLLGAMDQTANPCEDFHQYACGGWLRETPIPPGYPVWDRFQELSYKNMYMLKNLIESHKLYGSAQEKVKTFYLSCMDESKITRTDTLNDFRSQVLNISSESGTFSITDILINVHSLSTWPFFRLIVGPDERSTDKNIIKIEAGDSPFPYNIFRHHGRKVQTRSTETTGPSTTASPKPKDASEKVNEATDNLTVTVNGTEKETGYTVVHTNSSKSIMENVAEYPKENVTELIDEYLKETSSMMVALWKRSKADADKEARQILELERRISLAHNIPVHVHNRSQAYRAMTLSDLHRKCSNINWSTYFSKVFKTSVPFSINSEVIVLHENSLVSTCEILKEYTKNNTVQRILQDYLQLSIVRSLKPYFDLSTFQDIAPDKEIEQEGEPWRRCAFYANKALGYATGAIYVNGTSSHTSFKQVKSIVDYVKKGFKNYLLHTIWIDDKTRHRAEEKIEEMIEKVSYPDYILDTKFVDDYYKQFALGNDWFRNLINWRAFDIYKMAAAMTEKYDRAKSWINPPVTVESDYSAMRNDIIFPIAMLHLPIYSQNGPGSMNFGALGSLIGHEITHAFDVQGRQYDGLGHLRDWFDPVTASRFNTTTQCMTEQYSKYKINNMAIDGVKTLEENIADNGGVRAALVAYELWMKEQGGDKIIPGTDLKRRQVFFISFAQLFCSKWKDEGIKQFLLRDSHSPGPFRIQGALSNSLTFQDVFECSRTAKYNPSTKCQVW